MSTPTPPPNASSSSDPPNASSSSAPASSSSAVSSSAPLVSSGSIVYEARKADRIKRIAKLQEDIKKKEDEIDIAYKKVYHYRELLNSGTGDAMARADQLVHDNYAKIDKLEKDLKPLKQELLKLEASTPRPRRQQTRRQRTRRQNRRQTRRTRH
jgi:hypothetical protein